MMYYMVNRPNHVIIAQSTNLVALRNFRRRLADRGHGVMADYLIGHYVQPLPVLETTIDRLTFEHNVGFKGELAGAV